MSSYMLSCKASVINWSNAFREQSRKLECAMDSVEDKNGVKERILDEIAKAVKLVQYHALSSSGSHVPLGAESWVVQGLCRWVDRALLHGLRRLQLGYWPVMRTLAHRDTVSAVESLSHIDSPVGLGRAWLHMALTEGTLESHISALVREAGECPKEELEDARSLLRKHYTPRALLRDPSRASRFLAALFPLRTAHFCLDLDVSYFEVSCFVPGAVVGIGGFMGASWEQPFPGSEIGSGGCNTPMTSSLASSTLPSPGDSGVALLPDGDDADATEDDSSYSEIEDNRINRMLSMEMECKNDSDIVSTTVDIEYKSKTNEANEIISDSFKDSQIEVIRSKAPNLIGYSASLPRPCGDANNVQGNDDDVDLSEGIEDQLPSPTTGMYSESLVTMMPKSPTMTDSGILAESPVNEVANSTWVLDENRELNHVEEVKPAPEPEAPKEPCGVILRKNTRKKDAPVKRVSFHEDLQDNSSANGAVSNQAALETNVRHSWCSGDVNLQELDKDLAKFSSLKGSQVAIPNRNDAKETATSQSSLPPVTERGAPEGQEDPPSTGACRTPIKQTNRGLSSSETNIAKHLSMTSLAGKQMSSSVHLRGKPVAAVRPRRRCDVLSRIGSAQKIEAEGWGSRVDISLDKKHKKGWQWWPPLLVNGATPDVEACKALDDEIANEIALGERSKPSVAVGDCPKRVKELLKHEIVAGVGDEVYKVFKVRSTFSSGAVQSSQRMTGSPLLAVLSSRAFYVVGSLGDLKLRPGSWLALRGATTYEKRFEILYDDLDGVVVGPNYQTLTIYTKTNSKVKTSQRFRNICVTVGEKEVTMDVMSHLELAVRRWHQSAERKALALRQKQNSMSDPLPAIAILGLEKLAKYLVPIQPKGQNSEALRRIVGSLDGELSIIPYGIPFKILHYSLIHVEDEHPATPPCTPLGPTRRGHLMFHAHSILPGPTSSGSPPGWKPAYFLLKAGVLYKFDDALSRLPSWAIPLEGGQPSGPHGWECQGFRRVLDEPRPHTFEVLLGRGRSLRLAAADEYEASDWLQAFVQSASSGIDGCPDGLVGDVEGPFIQPCSLLLTDNGQVIICHEEEIIERARKKVMGQFETISMAYLSDVTSLRVAPDGAGYWCALEFDCREVHERGGDWILHFTSTNEMQSFLKALKSIWVNLSFPEALPLSVADEDELLSRCAHSSRHLASSWDTLLLSPHGGRGLEEVRNELTVR